MSESREPNDDAAPEPEPTRDERRLARGLEAARLLEAATELTLRARHHAKVAKKSEERVEARRALKKLLNAYKGLQEQAISKGFSKASLHKLEAVSAASNRAMSRFLESAPRKRTLRSVAEAAQDARHSL